MIKRGVILSFFLFVISSVSVFAEVSFSNAVIALGVENLVPFEVGETFNASVGRVFCFVRVVDGEPMIKHLWYYEDKLMAEVALDIKSRAYRTYSSKKIVPGWRGNWRVDLVASEGNVIQSVYFAIE